MLLHKVFDQEWLRHKFSPLLAETDSSPMYKAFLHTHMYQGQARTFQWRVVLGRMEYPVQLEVWWSSAEHCQGWYEMASETVCENNS